ncbi:alpha/beta hydrolase [Halanaerobium saccharolyticum]|uniref:alpha/beta hydrolase n=1 Tax=Halanaerobium saccharolyticum TaxID=43595 RepID=UPI003FCE769F
MKIFGKLLLLVSGLIAALLIFSTFYHIYQLRNEAKKYPPPGKLVTVDNNKMHIFTEGQGDITLVFMAGSGTSGPTIDFKPLWNKLLDEYRITVVEKAGYGWSEQSADSGDIEKMLKKTRKALKLSGEDGPYVLVPHSMSGLEAIHWAQKYPDEIKAIIGLDPAIPDHYLNSSFKLPSKSQLYSMYFMSKIGLTRFMGRSELEKNLPLLKSKDLTVEDKEKLTAVFYKSSLTKSMLNEIDYIEENASQVKRNGIPSDIPMYFFIAKNSDISIIPNWTADLSKYLDEVKKGNYKMLNTGHYVHHEKSDLIAQEIKRFIREKF